jgi:hypothetical protein
MQLKWASVLSLTVGSLAYMKQNELCGDSIECGNKCYQGRFHVALADNSAYFACKLSQPDEYTVGACKSRGHILDSACYSGKVCSKGCVLHKDDQDDYGVVCTQSNGSSTNLAENVSYQEALEAAGCDA